MDLYNNNWLSFIGDSLGNYILAYVSYKFHGSHSNKKILVEIDVIFVLFESLEIALESSNYFHILDYVIFSFDVYHSINMDGAPC